MSRRELTPMLLVFRNFNSHCGGLQACRDQDKAGELTLSTYSVGKLHVRIQPEI